MSSFKIKQATSKAPLALLNSMRKHSLPYFKSIVLVSLKANFKLAFVDTTAILIKTFLIMTLLITLINVTFHTLYLIYCHSKVIYKITRL
jgi:hypothetical protein